MTRADVANEIDAFISERSGKWDWDEFISLSLPDPELDEVRSLCARLPDIDPPVRIKHYCGERGMLIMRRLVADLREDRLLIPVVKYLEEQQK